MINAIEWFREKGFTFDDKITIKDVIELQQDAVKEGIRRGQCPQCGGTGGIDSGGFTPWGAGIELPCPSCFPETKGEVKP